MQQKKVNRLARFNVFTGPQNKSYQTLGNSNQVRQVGRTPEPESNSSRSKNYQQRSNQNQQFRDMADSYQLIEAPAPVSLANFSQMSASGAYQNNNQYPVDPQINQFQAVVNMTPQTETQTQIPNFRTNKQQSAYQETLHPFFEQIQANVADESTVKKLPAFLNTEDSQLSETTKYQSNYEQTVQRPVSQTVSRSPQPRRTSKMQSIISPKSKVALFGTALVNKNKLPGDNFATEYSQQHTDQKTQTHLDLQTMEALLQENQNQQNKINQLQEIIKNLQNEININQHSLSQARMQLKLQQNLQMQNRPPIYNQSQQGLGTQTQSKNDVQNNQAGPEITTSEQSMKKNLENALLIVKQLKNQLDSEQQEKMHAKRENELLRKLVYSFKHNAEEHVQQKQASFVKLISMEIDGSSGASSQSREARTTVPENEPEELEIPSFMRGLKLAEISKSVVGAKNTV